GGGLLTCTQQGRVCVNNTLVSAELYNAAKGTFSATGNMSVARFVSGATLLSNGQVLITGGATGTAPSYSNLSSAEIYTPSVLVPAPSLFFVSGDGKGQGAILHADTRRVASSDNPAVAGEALEIYLTGLTDGSVIPPQVEIGGRMAEVLYFGNAPGMTGVNQVNVRVPGGVAAGPAVPVRLSYIGRTSNAVTIAVK